jgi:hypothetical protein
LVTRKLCHDLAAGDRRLGEETPPMWPPVASVGAKSEAERASWLTKFVALIVTAVAWMLGRRRKSSVKK